VVARAASHDEVAASLAAYAAGTLEAERLGAVQVHLASGCEICLTTLFDAPVGKPRPLTVVAAAPPARMSAWSIVAILGLVAAVALAAVMVARERQLRTTSTAEILARVSEAARTEAELRDRLLVAKAVLRNQRRIADAEQEALARGADYAAQEAATLREELYRRRQHLARLEAELAGGRLANDVIAGEGLELRWLHPAGPFPEVRGHVLWRPVDGEMVVYAFGLPALPAGTAYEARVIVGQGRILSTRLRRRSDGRAFAYLALPKDGSPVHAVEVRRMSDARRFLIADATP
jgi:hypothetical protein